MKKVLTIILLVVLILCGLKFLVSCGSSYNGVSYDYDGALDLVDHLDDSNSLNGKKIFLKEYTIDQNQFFSTDTYVTLNDSTTLTIIDANGDCLPAGTYDDAPILVEIVGDTAAFGDRMIVAKVIE